MKRLLSLIIVLTLCISAAACAETTVSAKEFEASGVELNTKTNTLIVSNRETGKKYIADAELNPLSDEYEYISTKGNYFSVQNEDLKAGLLDAKGQRVLPDQYGDIDVISDRWIAGIRLEKTEDPDINPDYSSWFSNNKYMIEAVDVFYAGEMVGTLTRSDWKSATPYGDYLLVRNRDGKYAFYNKNLEKSEAEVEYSNEYDDDYSTKTIKHQGSNQPAFTEGCTLSPDEVKQSVWVDSKNQVLDLQGNVTADLSAYKYAYVDSSSNLIKVENGGGKHGLVDSTGKEIVACQYDSLGYDLNYALNVGYLYAENDGKGGFVNLATGEEKGFEFSKDAGNQHGSFIIVDDIREGKILISAMAGELPERFKDVTVKSAGDGVTCMYAVVETLDGTVRVIGQLGEDLLPGASIRSTYAAYMSDDGTLILTQGEEYGKYVLYTVHYDPDLSAIPAAAEPAEEPETWTCENGHSGLTGNFCPECGAKRPEE